MFLVSMFSKKGPRKGGLLPGRPAMAQLLRPYLSIEVQVALGSGETQEHHGSVLATWHFAEMVFDMKVHKQIVLVLCIFTQEVLYSFGTFNCLVCCFQKVVNRMKISSLNLRWVAVGGGRNLPRSRNTWVAL